MLNMFFENSAYSFAIFSYKDRRNFIKIMRIINKTFNHFWFLIFSCFVKVNANIRYWIKYISLVIKSIYITCCTVQTYIRLSYLLCIFFWHVLNFFKYSSSSSSINNSSHIVVACTKIHQSLHCKSRCEKHFFCPLAHS